MAAAAAFDDLQPCTVFPSDWGTLAVGWLSKDKPFTTGPVAPELLRALHRLGKPSGVLAYERRCELCPPLTAYEQAGVLFVPNSRGLFVAPRMVVHYIRSHGYRPPEAFLAAVRECPPGDSPEYRTALEAGPGGAQRPQPRLRGEYDTELIEVLQLPEAARGGAAMYVGDTGAGGVRECFRLVVHQALGEHLQGNAKHLRVEIDAEGWLTVEDDGRGVAPGVAEDRGRPRQLMDVLFSNVFSEVKVAAGQRAVRLPGMPMLGVGVVTALSSKMEVESRGDGTTQRAHFECGQLTSLASVAEHASPGLRIRCVPDPLIFDVKLRPELVEEELTQLAWLCPRLEVTFQGRAISNQQGPLTWVRTLAPGLVEESGLTAHGEVGAVQVDVGLGWSRNQRAPNLVSLVNFRRTSGGSHEEGLLAALRRAATRRGAEADRLLAGLTAVVHVSLDDQALEGEPGRWTLNSPEAAACVERAVTCAIDAAPWWWDRLCEAM